MAPDRGRPHADETFAIRCERLGKEYRLGAAQQRYDTLRDRISAAFAPWRQLGRAQAEQSTTLWALRDVSLEVAPGEVLGIIGPNGAGKSTFLRILSRITEPTEGWAETLGRVGSLLEVGVGFHPELSGRENVFLSGAILGMRRHEILRRFDEIVAFADVERFLDTPVKHYSTGMYLRLAFSVAAHLEPEILLVDEVLAVGDAAFQRRCLTKMGDVSREGRTVLLISHNMSAIENLCTRGIVLRNGELAFDGATLDAVRHYLSNSANTDGELPPAERRPGKGRVRFTRIRMFCDGIETKSLSAGGDVWVDLEYKTLAPEPATHARVAVMWTTLSGEIIFGCLNDYVHQPLDDLPMEGTIRLHVPNLPLNYGTYRLSVWMKTHQLEFEDNIVDALEFAVESGDFFGTGKRTHGQFAQAPVLVKHDYEVVSR